MFTSSLGVNVLIRCVWMKTWLIPVSEENWLVIKEENVYGAPNDISGLVRCGDWLAFYVMKSRSRRLGACFVGVFEVVGEWFIGRVPLWPDEKRCGRVLYPYRVKLKPVKLGVVKVEEVVDKLSFIKYKDKWQVYFRGCPANFKKPLPEEDVRLIVEMLG